MVIVPAECGVIQVSTRLVLITAAGAAGAMAAGASKVEQGVKITKTWVGGVEDVFGTFFESKK